MTLIVGSEVCFLSDYDFYYGIVEYVGKKIKINCLWPIHYNGKNKNYYRVKPEKVCAASEQVCIVWELWRGVNGRGGYRIERELYPERHMQAYDLRTRENTMAFVLEGKKP